MEDTTQQNPRKRFEVPVIRSSRPASLHLTNEQIDDLLHSQGVEEAAKFCNPGRGSQSESR